MIVERMIGPGIAEIKQPLHTACENRDMVP